MVAVGRLVPVKRFDLLMDVLAEVRRSVPDLQAVIVGEGYERAAPRGAPARPRRRRVDRASRVTWTTMSFVDLYRRAWVLASTSQREGWGMTATEAAACGTPAVVSRIAGHVDAVEDGVSGWSWMSAPITVDPEAEDRRRRSPRRCGASSPTPPLRARLGEAALRRASELTWEATAAGTLDALVDEADRQRKRPGR